MAHKHFLVLGASGSHFCDLALEEGHTLTLFVRNATKLPDSLRDHDSVAVIEGKLEDDTSLDEVSQCDADAFISFAGPPVGNKGTPLTKGYTALVPKLLVQNIKRLLILCTASFHGSEDQISFKWHLSHWTLKIFSPDQYGEMISVGEFVSSLAADDGVRWTLFRVGLLRNGPEAEVEATHLGSGKDVM
ncbi:uncharacterized protein N7458_007644 [Penicillium daleae]|uniref:NAD(P)-binding domain-containing protein n=1 Tax=Penicillium daleae TaxID=63821 RepID=A0AAD6G050_9EURO|nr:uncharacterized protein N7458_007644 [Penicillium daleae]KAJ5443772.1 hypothetical protein N7458_007644 [Penicillium daleae]